MRIGFIGLGIMGRPMASNLVKAGYQLTVFGGSAGNIDQLVAAGATRAGSSRQVAEQADLIITMLPNSPNVQDALLGPSGVIHGVKSGAIVVDMSSIAPLASQQIAAELAKVGVTLFDAPVSGGEPKAIDGTLAIMVGGPEAAFATVKPILQAMGSTVTHVGEIGSGNIAKLANQMIVAANIAAVAEAFVLSTKAGVDPAKVFAAIRGGLAGSTVMETKIPKILAGDFRPGFRIELHSKDLLNALSTAHDLGVPVPLTAQIMEILSSLKTADQAKNDHAAIIKYYEQLAKVEVRQSTNQA